MNDFRFSIPPITEDTIKKAISSIEEFANSDEVIEEIYKQYPLFNTELDNMFMHQYSYLLEIFVNIDIKLAFRMAMEMSFRLTFMYINQAIIDADNTLKTAIEGGEINVN